METFNSNLYSNIRNRMTGKVGNGKWNHNEEEESKMISDLQEYRHASKEQYMRSLLNPETHIAKVPSRLPVESAVADLRYNFTITPNATGKFVLIIDPVFQTGSLYQDATVNGLGAGVVTNLTFAQDANIIDQWRLVSSSLIIKYYGNFNSMSGLFVGATTSNVTAASNTAYLTFSNIEDLTNKQVLKCIDGIKMIYSPMDEKATEFNSNTVYTAGTHPSRWQYLFVVYGDLFPNSGFIRADYFRNIEYTSTPTYKEYIPQTKELPNDCIIPQIENTVSVAPRDFTGVPKKKSLETANPFLSQIGEMAKTAFSQAGKEALNNVLPLPFDLISSSWKVPDIRGFGGGFGKY